MSKMFFGIFEYSAPKKNVQGNIAGIFSIMAVEQDTLIVFLINRKKDSLSQEWSSASDLKKSEGAVCEVNRGSKVMPDDRNADTPLVTRRQVWPKKPAPVALRKNDSEFSIKGVTVTLVNDFTDEENFKSSKKQNQHDITNSGKEVQPSCPGANNESIFEDEGSSSRELPADDIAQGSSNQTDCRVIQTCHSMSVTSMTAVDPASENQLVKKPVFSSAKHSKEFKSSTMNPACLCTGWKPFCCTECPARFVHRSSLTKHLAAHSEGKIYSCAYCLRHFKHKSHLVEHLVAHSPFACKRCFQRFATKEELKKHSATHTSDFVCSICSARFKTKELLKQHSATHPKTFTCNQCSAKFTGAVWLWKHILTHSGPFACKLCSLRFKSEAQLKQHSAAHDKLYSCNQCRAQFKTQVWLWKHVLTHSDPFVCKLCSARFKSKEELEQHSETHPKLFSCKLCPAEFRAEIWLKRHEESHLIGHGSFSCKKCPAAFESELGLYRHTLSTHMDKEANSF